MRFFGERGIADVFGIHVDGDVHTRFTGVNDVRVDFDQVANADGTVKTDSPDIHRDAIRLRPIPRAGISRLVNPLHDHATVDVSTKVNVCRFADKLESDFVLRCHGGGYGVCPYYIRLNYIFHLEEKASQVHWV